MFAPQTIPVSPTVFMYRNPKRNSMYFRNSRMDYHCLSSIPQSTVYLRRRSVERSLSLACPCQGLGGSATMYILAQLLNAKILPSLSSHRLTLRVRRESPGRLKDEVAPASKIAPTQVRPKPVFSARMSALCDSRVPTKMTRMIHKAD